MRSETRMSNALQEGPSELRDLCKVSCIDGLKQTEFAVFRYFRYPFAEFRKEGDIKTLRQSHRDGNVEIETWRWRHGNMET
jgi:hypothetical protein